MREVERYSKLNCIYGNDVILETVDRHVLKKGVYGEVLGSRGRGRERERERDRKVDGVDLIKGVEWGYNGGVINCF